MDENYTYLPTYLPTYEPDHFCFQVSYPFFFIVPTRVKRDRNSQRYQNIALACLRNSITIR